MGRNWFIEIIRVWMNIIKLGKFFIIILGLKWRDGRDNLKCGIFEDFFYYFIEYMERLMGWFFDGGLFIEYV